MRRASIAAVARHDALGCVLTRWLGSSRADDRENRTGHPVRCGTTDLASVCAGLFLVLGLSCYPLKTRAWGGRAGRGSVIGAP
eukprot:296971-Prymnesium_polylepis.1